MGPFTIEARQKILDRLLAVQEKTRMCLISEDEISRIQQIWTADAIMSATRLFEEYRKIKTQNEEQSTVI